MRKLFAAVIIMAFLASTGFYFLDVDSLSGVLPGDDLFGAEPREFQKGGAEATQQEISTARSRLQGDTWKYEETRTSDDLKQVSFNDDKKSAEVIMNSEGKVIEIDFQKEDDGNNTVVYEKSEAVKIARNALSGGNWTLASSLIFDGVYNFEFKRQDSRANVKVDGSMGEVIRKKISFGTDLQQD